MFIAFACIACVIRLCYGANSGPDGEIDWDSVTDTKSLSEYPGSVRRQALASGSRREEEGVWIHTSTTNDTELRCNRRRP